MTEVRTFATEDAPAGVLDDIRRLMDAAFEGDFSDEDWEHTLGGSHVVVVEAGVVVSHAAVVQRVLEVADRALRTGYVEGVGTAPGREGEGLGSIVMSEAGNAIRGAFEMGALGTGAHAFYERLGWERWRGPTYVRRGTTLIRTEAEDDGVMALRFGASADVDLTAPISCEERRGDDW